MAILVLCAVAVSFISISGALDLEIFHSPKKVLANTDVLLKCKATNYDKSDLDIKFVAVKWKVIYSSGVQKDLYTFNGGTHAISRPGAKIFDDEILEGNASLYLPNIQLEERGVYFCTVYITPEKEEVTGELLVIDQPEIILSTAGHKNSSRSIRCDVIRSYPEKLEISWFKTSQGKTEHVLNDSSTETPVRNKDGAFSVSSTLNVVSSGDEEIDDNVKYKCVVKYETFPDNFAAEISFVTSNHDPIPAIVGGVIGGLLCAICAAIGIYWWKNYRVKGAQTEEQTIFLRKGKKSKEMGEEEEPTEPTSTEYKRPPTYPKPPPTYPIPPPTYLKPSHTYPNTKPTPTYPIPPPTYLKPSHTYPNTKPTPTYPIPPPTYLKPSHTYPNTKPTPTYPIPPPTYLKPSHTYPNTEPPPTYPKPPPPSPKPPPTDTKPPPTDPKPPPTDAKPPPTDPKPPPTDTKPPPTDPKPSLTDPKPPPTDAKPPPTDAKPPPTDPKQPPTDTEPSPTDSKPTLTDTKPTPTKRKLPPTDLKQTSIEPSRTDLKPSPTDPKPTSTECKPPPTDPKPTPTEPSPTDTKPTPTEPSSVFIEPECGSIDSNSVSTAPSAVFIESLP
eukprot:gi/632941756/ref/XP_007886036.1/ PREDICTED: uncharacterized protein LOC103175083 [Callorhinchus milii]